MRERAADAAIPVTRYVTSDAIRQAMQRLTSNQCQLGPGDFELVARCESGTTGRNRRAIVAWDFGSFETDQPHLVADAFDGRHRDTDATQRKLQLRELHL